MVRINRRLLPIKAHFLFFMAAMGPILPQLSVLGRQIGIDPEVMGYINSVLPVMYVLAKPLFGFIADYFMSYRKTVFVLLIAVMTVSYGSFHFVPMPPQHKLSIDAVWNVSWSAQNVSSCSPEILATSAICSSTRPAVCGNQSGNRLSVYFTHLETGSVLPNNVIEKPDLNVCLAEVAVTPTEGRDFNGSCHFPPELQVNCVYGTTSFWMFTILLCCGTIGFNVVNSISDAICFDVLGEEEQSKYGAQRVWGTIGFGATALFAGIAVDLWTTDTVKSFLPALLIMLVFSCLDLLSVSRLQLPKLTSSESIFKDVWKLTSQPQIAIFLVFATVAGIIDSFIIYFMFWHMEEVGEETGFMEQIKLIEGCVVAAECLCGELPFFFYSGKIIKKIGYVHCMSLCFFFYAVRLSLISWIPNPWYLVGVELFFQGCTYALCYTCIVAYASAIAPPGTSATVQGLIAGMDDGLGFSIGSLIGGITFKRYGGRRSFRYFAVMALCTCLAHLLLRPSSKKQLYLPQRQYELAPIEELYKMDTIPEETTKE